MQRGRGAGTFQHAVPANPEPDAGKCTQTQRSHNSLFNVCVCLCVYVSVHGLHASAKPDHDIDSALSPVSVIDPRLDIGVASSDSYRFYLLDKPSTVSRWRRNSRVQACTWKKKAKKSNALMFLPYENMQPEGKTEPTV